MYFIAFGSINITITKCNGGEIGEIGIENFKIRTENLKCNVLIDCMIYKVVFIMYMFLEYIA